MPGLHVLRRDGAAPVRTQVDGLVGDEAQWPAQPDADDRQHRVSGVLGQLDHQVVALAVPVEPRPAGAVLRHPGHARRQARQPQPPVGRWPHRVEVQLAPVHRHLAPGLPAEAGGRRLEPGAVVALQPRADAAQHVRLEADDGTVTARPDVEQVVPAAGPYAQQPAHQGTDLAGLVLALLPAAVAPRLVVDGGGRLPGAVQGDVRHLVVAHHPEVARVVPHPAADRRARLEPVHQTREAAALRGRRRRHVEPHLGDRPVPGHQFPQLPLDQRFHRGGDRVAVVRVEGVARVPVDEGEVDTELQPLRAALAGQRLERVLAVGGAVHDVVVRGAGVEHREAVVVLGRDDDVLHPGVLRQ